jgi:subtilase family serine protease
VAGAIAVSAPSQAARSAAQIAVTGPLVPLRESVAPSPPAGAVRLGPLAPATRISVDVSLKLPDQARLNAFLAGLADKKSPFYGHFLRPGQFGPMFGPMFGPSLARVAVVEKALRLAGLASYRLPDGRVAYANSAAPRLPASAAALVNGVVGLENLYLRQSHIVRPNGPVVPRTRMRAAASTARAT